MNGLQSGRFQSRARRYILSMIEAGLSEIQTPSVIQKQATLPEIKKQPTSEAKPEGLNGITPGSTKSEA